jgi:D-alanyl-D-alanine carboxypeptidase/D-alanyl-D-alanine-endopeptidase (penicillin-binding protein 4)
MARPFLRLAAVALLLPPVLVTSASAAPRPVVVLAPLGTAAPAPSAAAVNAALAGPSGAAALGGDLTGEVVDVQSGVVLWQRSPAEPVLVASTQKLLIAAAALSVLGAGAAPTTTLESTGTAAAGVLTGDLYLRGGGDVLLQPTPSTGWPTTASLDGLAAALRATGITAVHGRLVADGSAFTGAAEAPGWRTSYVTQGSVAPVSALEVDRGLIAGSIARAQDPPYAAAVQLRAALARHGITVSGATTEATTTSPRRSAARWPSPSTIRRPSRARRPRSWQR